MSNRKGTSGEIEDLTRQVVPILRNGAVIEASVLGSIIHGEVQPNSDFDLLFRYKKGANLLDVGSLKCELEELLGLNVDLIPRIT
jgi:predicted nucleotidyltransferase